MNARMFTIAVLASALPMIADGRGADVSFSRGDFVATEKVAQNGEKVLSVKLSKSGKAKIKKLNDRL